MKGTADKKKKIEVFREFLQGIWDEMLPTMVEKTVEHTDFYRDLILLEKLLKEITKELKERALLFPDYYPVKITERKNFVYNQEETILKDLIRKYHIVKFAKLKNYTSLQKAIKGEELTLFISSGLIVEKITKIPKLEG